MQPSTQWSSSAKPSRTFSAFTFSLYIAMVVIAALPVSFIIYAYPMQSYLSGTDAPRTISRSSRVRCFTADDRTTGAGGLGSAIRRNQLAFFLADVYATKLAFTPLNSSFGYSIDSMFSTCPASTPECHINLSSLLIPRCRRGDCQCNWDKVRRFFESKAARCFTMQITTDQVQTSEYSGCVQRVLTRYLALRGDPQLKYDVIHYDSTDADDEAQKQGNSTVASASSIQFYHMLETMCSLSSRSIVVLTHGRRLIPKVGCTKRIILAVDTSHVDAFSIMRHATIVSAGESAFAQVLVEVSSPERLVIPARAVSTYEWVFVKHWTVVSDHGIPFHFNDKEIMLDTMLSSRSPDVRTWRLPSQYHETKITTFQPNKTYSPDSFWENASLVPQRPA